MSNSLDEYNAMKIPIEALAYFFCLREDNMLRFLESLRKKHGSIEQCIKNHKLLDDEGISRLRNNMIVDAATNQSTASKSRHLNFFRIS